MKAGTQEVNRFFSVTITDKWIPTQLNYISAINHRKAAEQLEHKSKRITNERYREIETTGKYYLITEQCKGGTGGDFTDMFTIVGQSVEFAKLVEAKFLTVRKN